MSKRLFWWAYFWKGVFSGDGVGGEWGSLFLEGVFTSKMVCLIFGRDFASENAAPERMWVQGGGTEFPVVSTAFR